MIIEDALYGEIVIDHPLIERLIESRLFLRLKKIGLHGPFLLNRHFQKKKMTYFDHSVGCYALAKKMNLPLSCQVACLLYPSRTYARSLTCFAYLEKDLYKNDSIMYNNHVFSQKYEKAFARLFATYGITMTDTTYVSRPWLHDDWPHLTVSRLDLILRDAHLFYEDFIEDIIDHMSIQENRLVLSCERSAQRICDKNVQLHTLFWGHPYALLMNQYWQDAIQYARKREVLKKKHDALPFDECFKRLTDLKYPLLRKKISLFKQCQSQHFVLSDRNDGICLKKEWRLIDPYIQVHDRVVTLSSKDFGHKAFLLKSIHPQYVYITLL